MVLSLEIQFDMWCKKLKIQNATRNVILNNMNFLRTKSEKDYNHSIRAAILSARVAQVIGLDAKAVFIAGALHDFGKAFIDVQLLKKKGEYTKAEKEKMKKHVEIAYDKLQAIYPFSAEIVLRHHCYQKDAYPIELPKSRNHFSKEDIVAINKLAKTFSLVDFYDARITRTDKGLIGRKNHSHIKEAMLKEYPNERESIELLFRKKVFSRPIFGMGLRRRLVPHIRKCTHFGKKTLVPKK